MKFPILKSANLLTAAVVGLLVMSPAKATLVAWNDWTFDYEVGVNNDGLALKNVSYKNHSLLKKISFPVFLGLVKDGSGDPVCRYYFDQIGSSVSPMPWANNATVAQRQFTLNGTNWFEIGVRKLINNKDYFQAYYLSADGLLDAHIYVRGEPCSNGNAIGNLHAYLPYWRIDTDVDGAANDVIESFSGNTSTFNPQPVEFNLSIYRNTYVDQWRVRDKVSNAQLNIWPGYSFPHPDGNTTISLLDRGSAEIDGRLYKASEDIGWPNPSFPFSVPYDANMQVDNQDVNRDIVAWYKILTYNSITATSSINTWYSTGISLVSSYTNPLPDVVVDQVSYDNNGYFTAVIRNQGTAITPLTSSVGVGFYVDGEYKTWATIKAIRPNDIAILKTTDAARYFVPGGTQTVTAMVDDINRFQESREDNNKLSISLNLPASPTVNINSPAKNATVSGASAIFAARATDPSGIKGGGVSFQIDGQAYVSPWSTPYTMTLNMNNFTEGNHTLLVTATNKAGVTSGNNLTFKVVHDANSLPPDIEVKSLSYANGIFTATIKNSGAGPVPATVPIGLGFYVDGTYVSWGRTDGPLAAGESRTLNSLGGAFRIPSGTHTIKVWADNQSTTTDGNNFSTDNPDSNNVLSTSVTIP